MKRPTSPFRPRVWGPLLVAGGAFFFAALRAGPAAHAQPAAALFEKVPPAVREQARELFSEAELRELLALGPAQIEQRVRARLRARGENPQILKGAAQGQPPPVGVGAGGAKKKEVQGRRAAEARKGPVSALRRYLRSRSDLPAPERDVRRFGASLFSRGPQPFVSKESPVVPDSYRVGPGDVVSLYLWGRVSRREQVPVDREGGLDLPIVGRLGVAGMNYVQMVETVESAYAGSEGVHVSLSLKRLRTVQVLVLGEAVAPGRYTVSALDSVLNLLLQSGGPTSLGTLRRIELRRAGRRIGRFDLYESLLEGKARGELRLEEGDVLFIPRAGPQVAIVGYVRRPGIYELKGRQSLQDLIDMAAGLSPSASRRRITIERIEQGQSRRRVLDLSAADLKEPVTLHDEDVVSVYPVLPNPEPHNRVVLGGYVREPGGYAWHPGMRVSELLGGPEALQPEAYLPYALVRRQRPPEYRPEVLSFSLSGLFAGEAAADLSLQALDEITVFAREQVMQEPTVEVSGTVGKAGSFRLAEGMRVRDLVYAAGGPGADADLSRADLFRIDPLSLRPSHRRLDLGRALKGEPEHDLLLLPRDRLVVFSVWNANPRLSYEVIGAVNKPGRQRFAEGLRLADAIWLAGYLSPDASELEGEVFYQRTIGGSERRVESVPFSPERALAGDPAHNLPVEPRAIIQIRSVINAKPTRYVELVGELAHPGQYPIGPGETLARVLRRAGGLSPSADPRASFFTRTSAREIERARVAQMIRLLRSQSLTESAEVVGDARALELQTAGHRMRLALIADLQAVKPSGRVVIDLPAILAGQEVADFPLEGGDRLVVLQRTKVVHVVGEVFNPGAFVATPDWDVVRALNAAGGPTDQADLSNLYVIRANGLSLPPSEAFEDPWYGSPRGAILAPGDAVVVPRYIPGTLVGWLVFKDAMTVLYQAALASAAVNALAK